MCYTAVCPVCGKTTWQGCGQHVDEVMRNVPQGQRCTCPPSGDTGGAAPRRRRWF